MVVLIVIEHASQRQIAPKPFHSFGVGARAVPRGHLVTEGIWPRLGRRPVPPSLKDLGRFPGLPGWHLVDQPGRPGSGQQVLTFPVMTS